uniref:Laccase 2 n=1 Tax=Flammulina velutipes TaxID=38945 RepID=Q2AAD1_FLAVE|nr:laccase 2 [Flammulina velutipes]
MSRSLTAFITLSLLVLRSFAGIGPITDLVIANADVAPDGFTRTAALSGGTVNGALITGSRGDNFQINVVNNLNDNNILQSTSIHWHGMFMAGTSWADGPAFVNQCPIAKSNSFVYDFTALEQAGTFWYHSHLSSQYCDGIRGPMVIYDPDDPHAALYDVDNDDTVITLADWYHAFAKTLAFPTPDSTLINGLGRWAEDPTSDLAVINVEAGVRYRFRLVSMSCDPNFVFAIQGHTLNIIEADGVSTEPIEVDQITIFAGQRYSFVLTAEQAVDNYWIRAEPTPGPTGFEDGINSAILRYSGAAEAEPTDDTVESTNPLDENALVPLENPGADGTAEVGADDVFAINLALAFDLSTFKFTVNGATFEPPTTPVLLQLLSGAQTADTLLPAGSLFTLPANRVVELSIPSEGLIGGPHPFHLHGHVFDVIRGPGQTDYNFENPPRRDVVSIGAAGDNVTIRFTTDNPGPWFLHCHIDWHLEAGLALVFAEDTDNWDVSTPPTSWDELCPIYDALSEDDL